MPWLCGVPLEVVPVCVASCSRSTGSNRHQGRELSDIFAEQAGVEAEGAEAEGVEAEGAVADGAAAGRK